MWRFQSGKKKKLNSSETEEVVAYLVRPGLPVHKVLLFHTLQVLVLLQVLTHLHMFRVGLEVGVSCRCRLVGLLQLRTQKVMAVSDSKCLNWLLSPSVALFLSSI